MKRHNKFPDIPGLDNELDLIVSELEKKGGQKVDKLPPPNQVDEFARFYVKQTDGTYKKYVKLGNDFIED